MVSKAAFIFLAFFLFLMSFSAMVIAASLDEHIKTITERTPGVYGQCHESGHYISLDGRWTTYSELEYRMNADVKARINLIASRLARGMM